MHQLDLNAPLMSTRRHSYADNMNHPYHTSRDASLVTVPFSWERAPGVPKDVGKSARHSQRKLTKFLPPMPPPGHQCCKMHSSNFNDVYSDDEDDVFSDHALKDGTASFSESFGVAYRLSDASVHDQYQRAPSFIMNRFLPAADAVASNSSNPPIPKYSRPSPRVERDRIKPSSKPRTPKYSTSRAENIDLHQSGPPSLDLPKSLKRIVCGFKSPVRSHTSIANCSALTVRTNSIKTSKTVGLTMPFLDTSRLRLRGRSSDVGKEKEFTVARDADIGSGRSLDRRGSSKVSSEKRTAPSWGLPSMRSPSEPWLLDALSSTNYGR